MQLFREPIDATQSICISVKVSVGLHSYSHILQEEFSRGGGTAMTCAKSGGMTTQDQIEVRDKEHHDS